jgi:hypothetical protein
MGPRLHDRFAIGYPGNADVKKAADGSAKDKYDH